MKIENVGASCHPECSRAESRDLRIAMVPRSFDFVLRTPLRMTGAGVLVLAAAGADDVTDIQQLGVVSVPKLTIS